MPDSNAHRPGEGEGRNEVTLNLTGHCEYAEKKMPDKCKAGLWDINPEEACPICGAAPDTDCEKAPPPGAGQIRTAHFHRRAMPIRAVLTALSSQENKDDDEGNVMAAAANILTELFAIAERAPELNMSNYDENEVSELNAAMVEIYLLLKSAIEP